MANASKTHMAPAGTSGKGDGSGGMADDTILEGRLGENMVLSNRDKKLHTGERGLDGKAVQTDQLQDHAANQAGSESAPDGLTADTPPDDTDAPPDDTSPEAGQETPTGPVR